ncbi:MULTISPECIES: MobV family relaxase [Bacteroidales]|nr:MULTISPECIES: MobV family relaxase [Bacteroidales]MCC2204497.1 plasmid recombination protein [Parabacteroides distasonis]MCS2857424.1 plasmid recombination protein [Parabacteroides distasonis]MDB9149106.1 plasmid recombination protein [Parabacteroides distasonis]RHM57532.1 mobilization protein [Parabacteroides distasonis]UYI68224.1 MAG: plasmid recombination protein [Alistipes onderdonkii]
MGYFSLDIKKAKGTSDTTQSDHIERKIIPKNADPTRTHLNRVLVEYPDGVHGRDEAIVHRLNTAGIRRKITHDQVRVVRVVLSGTHEDMMNIQEKGELDEWCSDSIQWLQATFGKDNVVAAHLHMDEKTPHIHAAVVPIVTGERRKAKKEQADGKRKYRKKTNSVRLCADDLFNRQTLIAYHDNYARVMTKYGLQRGVRGSEARHTTTMQYYRDLKKKNETLETETRLLQEKKAEAQEELKQVKAEIRTDKLKSAATDTATALASSVGSLFGSGRMKSLERRNEDLQDRILELEDEARQRERQQAEQIQEIRNAYEQQHRKLSEFTDFVRRYFPYVEKLMPVINFLRERLGFNDGIIRRLCEFKEVGIKGELYSSEFNRSFDTRHSVCSIKQDESGKFDFKIDGVSHVSWFRKKMNEFRETIGIPKQRQDRGIKL